MIKGKIKFNKSGILIRPMLFLLLGSCQLMRVSSKREVFPTTKINHEEHGCFGVLDQPTIIIEQVGDVVIAKSNGCIVKLNGSGLDSISRFYHNIQKLKKTEEHCSGWSDETYILTIQTESQLERTFVSSCEWPFKEFGKLEASLFKNCD